MALHAFVADFPSDAHEFAQAGEDARLGRLAEVLRDLRLAIPLQATYLGSFIRLKNRVGKVVSQEEFAEAIGVSRCWYGMLESALPHFSHLILKTISTPPSEAP